MKSIVIADDHKLFRSGLREIIESNPDYEIIGEAANGLELVDLVAKLSPDLAVIDISMPLMSGLEALIKFKEMGLLGTRTLFLSMYDSEEYVYAVSGAGGDGLLNKNIDKQELFLAIHKIVSGEKYFKDYSSTMLVDLENRFSSLKQSILINYKDLTEREKKILILISEGNTSSEIAEQLNLSKRTIDTHRTNLIQKLNLRSMPDLVRFSIQFSLLYRSQRTKKIINK
jgi:two-component system, NarL family, response regulator NreC